MQIKKGESPRTQKLKKEARKKSIKEGCFSTLQYGFGGAYISPFAIAINATNSQVALLSSFPGLLGPLSQLFGSRLIEKHSRKKIILKALLFESLVWLPIILLSYLFYKNIFAGYLPLMLIIFFSIHTIFGHIALPSWFSWMGDIIPANKRGKYFSKRNAVVGAISIIATITAAFFLDFFEKNGLILLGFSIFFFLAMISRLIGRNYFKKKYEPKIKLKKTDYFSFWQFIKKMPHTNFGKFTIFRALMGFATSIAGPFFAIYMLRNLEFNYVIFMAVTLSASIFSLFIMPIWGKFSDLYGNYEVLKITSILIPVIPLLWLFSESPIYLALGPGMISGIAWAGFNLATGNFIYDSVKPQKRGIIISYYNLLNGIGIFLGAGFGALIARYALINFMNIILFIFFISGMARILVTLIMLPRIKEIREVEKFDKKRVFKNTIFRTKTHEILPNKTTKQVHKK